MFNNPLKYIDPTGYKSTYYRDWDYSGFTPPPNHGGFGWNSYYNYIAPPLGSGISSFAGNFGNPFSMGGGSWVNSFGKYTYQQSLNLRFWNSLTSQILNYGHDYNVTPISAFGRITFVGSFGPLGKWIINNNGAISFENPTSGVHLSAPDVVRSRIDGSMGNSWQTAVNMFNNSLGGFGTGMTILEGNFRIQNTKGFSPKFYYKPNAAGLIFKEGFGIKTYNTANWGRGIGYGSLAVSITLGGIYVANAWQQDGNTYGVNTQMAVAQTSLSITGAWAGAEIGAAIGLWFGGVGVIPGAVIGGLIGGWGGSILGKKVVNNFSSY